MGSAITYTEFINVLDVPQMLPYIRQRVAFSTDERPVGFQLYGSSVDEILPAALQLMQFKPDFFDLNLGCSERRVASRGAGAGLLQYPHKIEKIVSALVTETGLPITAKIRIGPAPGIYNHLEISKLLESCGICLLAVHGRTRGQRWRDPALWEPVAQVAHTLSIPVIGNGDIQTVKDIDRRLEESGCEAVMIGRGAVGNPWIFSGVEKSSLSRQAILTMIRYHWEKVVAFSRSKEEWVGFNKHLKAYLSCPQFFGLDLKKLLTSKEPVEELFAMF